MPIDLETLKSEREQLKGALRSLEGEQRSLQGEVKKLRQREIRTKREVEALTTLIDMQKNESGKEAGGDPGKD